MSDTLSIETIRLTEIHIAPYQRAPIAAHGAKIAAEYDEHLVGILDVSLRNANYWMLDGQHRKEALLKRGIVEATCLVHKELTYEQEASLFKHKQLDRKNVSAYDKFRADIEAKNQAALTIQEIATNAGYKIGRKNSIGEISAIAALDRIYNRYGADTLRRVLAITYNIWLDDSKAVSGTILEGLALFLDRKPDTSRSEIERKLATKSPSLIIRKAKVLRADAGGSVHENTYRAISQEWKKRRAPRKEEKTTE